MFLVFACVACAVEAADAAVLSFRTRVPLAELLFRVQGEALRQNESSGSNEVNLPRRGGGEDSTLGTSDQGTHSLGSRTWMIFLLWGLLWGLYFGGLYFGDLCSRVPHLSLISYFKDFCSC